MMDKEIPPPPALAHVVGTVNAIDRSRQYTRTDNGELLRSLNTAWEKIRLVEQENRKKDLAITALHASVRRWRGSTILLTSIITGVMWEAVKLLVPMLLRYLGFS